jgi:hypothetical protein
VICKVKGGEGEFEEGREGFIGSLGDPDRQGKYLLENEESDGDRGDGVIRCDGEYDATGANT